MQLIDIANAKKQTVAKKKAVEKPNHIEHRYPCRERHLKGQQ